MVKKALSLMAVLFLLTSAGYIFAQSSTSNSSSQKNQQSNTLGQTITGVVALIDIDKKKVIIQDDATHQKKTFTYTDRTMWRNPISPGRVTDLRIGSRVTATINDTTIVRADIFSKEPPSEKISRSKVSSSDTQAPPK